jgi:acetylornithine deacetylase
MQRTLLEHVVRRQERLIEITRRLIQTPSENTPPIGAEANCQRWLAEQLTKAGLEPDLYELHEAAELRTHPLYWPGRSYSERPNVAARLRGAQVGRSLILSGHIDTVPRGTQDWTQDPFSGAVSGNRIYGRGSNDMKAGVAINLFAVECLQELKLQLAGDLVFESVVDEEFGGCNGTLAGRLRGYKADAAIISEPSSLRICAAQRGGRTAHIAFRAPTGGVLQDGRFPQGIIPQLTRFLDALPAFSSGRNARVKIHQMYAGHADPVPVSVTKIFTSPWGYREPITVPDAGHLELYWQLMPGETQYEVEGEFFNWLQNLVTNNPGVFSETPEVLFPLRWLPGSAISASEPLVEELSECAQTAAASAPKVCGIEGPCDMFIFHEFNIPAVLWGPTGGNTHAADEYVEIDSMLVAAKTLLLFIAEWCGTVA